MLACRSMSVYVIVDTKNMHLNFNGTFVLSLDYFDVLDAVEGCLKKIYI